MTREGPLASLAERLATAADTLAALRPAIEAGEPWPLADVYGAEPEASWGPRELLAHVDEMLPYWLGEIERILEWSGDGPAPFGRLQTDPTRIGLIGRDRTVPLRELFARLTADSRRVAGRLAELTAAEAAREGAHPARGVVTVATIANDSIVGHLEGHLTQLRGILAAT